MKNGYGRFYSVTLVKQKFIRFYGCTYYNYVMNPKILVLAECESLMWTHLAPWHGIDSVPYCYQVIP